MTQSLWVGSPLPQLHCTLSWAPTDNYRRNVAADIDGITCCVFNPSASVFLALLLL